jgi:hypothetical protein
MGEDGKISVSGLVRPTLPAGPHGAGAGLMITAIAKAKETG